MKRRHIAALAVFIPVILVTILKIYYPVTYNVLGGYMLAIALVFKSALMTFFTASKLKLLAYIKGLTLIQGTYVLIKRWFLDNVFARWLKKNITDHIMVGIKDMSEYYKSLNLKAKMKNILIPILLSAISAWTLYTTGYLDNLILFTELKVIVIGVSKTIVMMGTKFFGLMINSWITPILEVFALSYIFSYLERVLGKNNPIIRALNWIGEKLNRVIFFFADINERHIDPLLNDHVSNHSKNLSSKLSNYIKRKKVAHEYEQFEKFEQRILKGHISAYHTFAGMSLITDKRELYTKINYQTDDNLDIVAYASRNKKGELLPEAVEDSYYHDIFILEGIASSHRHGIREAQSTDPDHSDFWVLNTSIYPALLKSHTGHVPTQEIRPNSIILVKTNHPQDYSCGDIYFEFRGRSESAMAIPPRR